MVSPPNPDDEGPGANFTKDFSRRPRTRNPRRLPAPAPPRSRTRHRLLIGARRPRSPHPRNPCRPPRSPYPPRPPRSPYPPPPPPRSPYPPRPPRSPYPPRPPRSPYPPPPPPPPPNWRPPATQPAPPPRSRARPPPILTGGADVTCEAKRDAGTMCAAPMRRMVVPEGSLWRAQTSTHEAVGHGSGTATALGTRRRRTRTSHRCDSITVRVQTVERQGITRW